MSLTPENISLLKEKRQHLQNELIITSSATKQFELKYQIAEIDAKLAGTDVAKLSTLGEIVQTENLSLVFKIIHLKVDFGSDKSVYYQILRDYRSDSFGLLELKIRKRLNVLLNKLGANEMLLNIKEFSGLSGYEAKPDSSQNPVTQNTIEMNSLRSHEGISVKTVRTDLFKWKTDFKRRNPKLSDSCSELLEKVGEYELKLEQDLSFDSSLRRLKDYVKKYRGLKLRAEKKQDEKFENFESEIQELLGEGVPSLKNLEKAHKRLKLKGYQNPTAEQLIEDEIEDEDMILDVVENMEAFLETL